MRTKPDAVARLRAAGVDNPQRDLRILFREAYAIGQSAGAQTEEEPNALTQEMFDIFLGQRLARKPVSQIIQRRSFWRHDFLVTPDVLDPRPDTEALILAALEQSFSRVLDLGTGSGCILVSLLADRSSAAGVGVDQSAAALAVAERNASKIGVADRVAFHVSDWFASVQARFDLIVSNPPYIPPGDIAALQPEVRNHEPHMALTDGVDGLEPYRIICAQASDYLSDNGRLIMEFGAGQWPDIQQIATAAGWSDVTCRHDLDGRPRVLVAQNPQ